MVVTRESSGADACGAACTARPDADSGVLSFDTIFTHYHQAIYGYLLGLVGDVAQAQDLTQDTFLKAYTALPRTPDPALPTWLYRIATDTAFAALRRQRLRWLPFASSDEDRWPDPAPNLPARCAEREAVGAALARLSPRDRACLLLRARTGLTIEEVTQALGISNRATRRMLYRVKERWRPARDKHRVN